MLPRSTDVVTEKIRAVLAAVTGGVHDPEHIVVLDSANIDPSPALAVADAVHLTAARDQAPLIPPPEHSLLGRVP